MAHLYLQPRPLPACSTILLGRPLGLSNLTSPKQSSWFPPYLLLLQSSPPHLRAPSSIWLLEPNIPDSCSISSSPSASTSNPSASLILWLVFWIWLLAQCFGHPGPAHLPLYPELWELPPCSPISTTLQPSLCTARSILKCTLYLVISLLKPLQSLPMDVRIKFKCLIIVLQSHEMWIPRSFTTALFLPSSHSLTTQVPHPPPTDRVRPRWSSA